jgi:hypothetical protein
MVHLGSLENLGARCAQEMLVNVNRTEQSELTGQE